MKIFSTEQIHNWDAYTILHEPVSSIDLMERAAKECFTWINENIKAKSSFAFFCGTGNNGGDGLALAQLLKNAGYEVIVYILDGEKKSVGFSVNLERLLSVNITPYFIDENNFPQIEYSIIIIDALFGNGLNRPLQNDAATLVEHLNKLKSKIISIDVPSGLFIDRTSKGNIIVKATHTLTFQSTKLAFLLAENEAYIGKLHILDIGLSNDYYNTTNTIFATADESVIESIYKPRNQFSHKYDFGHSLLFAGSNNMMGAAVLCAKACLRSGSGLVTVYTEENTQVVIQSAFPEAITSGEKDFEKITHKKSAIGIGPGLEASIRNRELLDKIIKDWNGPVVIDATALNLLTENPAALIQRKQNPAILTPHTGEFEKLFGKTADDFERLKLAMDKSSGLNCFIILKGHFTFIACPNGTGYFNTTGNAGMATAGSGDVLTGMLTGLLAQGYSIRDACIFGVYLHGFAGDITAEKLSQEAMISGDIIDCIGAAFKHLLNKKTPQN